MNPGYTGYMAQSRELGKAFVILANCSSEVTVELGEKIIRMVTSSEPVDLKFSSKYERLSLLLLALLIICGFLSICLFYRIYEIFSGTRKFKKITGISCLKITFIVLAGCILLSGLIFLPGYLFQYPVSTIFIWYPFTFKYAVVVLVISLLLCLLIGVVGILWQHNNYYLSTIPGIVVLSIFSGFSNMAIVVIITKVLTTDVNEKNHLIAFVIIFLLYIFTRRYVQVRLLRLSMKIILEFRVNLVEKILLTTYSKFEKLERGKIYSTLNDDIRTIGDSANILINILVSIITVVGVLFYLATLAFWVTIIMVTLILFITVIYYLISRNSNALFEQARDTRSSYMEQLNGLIDGFKELSMSYIKKNEYRKEVTDTCQDYRNKMVKARTGFINAFIVGESLLILTLFMMIFIVPRFFPVMDKSMVSSFVVVLMYLIGPVNTILHSIPTIVQLRVSWKRVKLFTQEVPADLTFNEMESISLLSKPSVTKLNLKNVAFRYGHSDQEESSFVVGPVSLTMNSGEATFITGGTGSGKTTLAKLITGLYEPQQGIIEIDDEPISSNALSEFFTTVFNPFHLFPTVYRKPDQSVEDPAGYLSLLKLDKKVKMNGNKFSTLNLSTGQKKRLALLQCFLEDKPIFLFDEWAADQGPEYRKIFYTEIVPMIKEKGKILICITHDDHYFHLADKIIKLNMGQAEIMKEKTSVTHTNR